MEWGSSALVALAYAFSLVRDVTTLDPVVERLPVFQTANNLAVPVHEPILDMLPRMGKGDLPALSLTLFGSVGSVPNHFLLK